MSLTDNFHPVMQRIKKHIGTHHITGPSRLALIILIILLGAAGYFFSFKSYRSMFSSSVTMEQADEISLVFPLVFHFSQPMMTGKYGEQVRVKEEGGQASEKVKIIWSQESRKLTIRPMLYWKPERKYIVSLPGGRNIFFSKMDSRDFSFSTVPYPKVKEINPPTGAKDVIIDLEGPITVALDRPAKDFFVQARITPESELVMEADEQRTTFKFVPKAKILDGVEHKLIVSVRANNYADKPENFRKIGESTFTTKSLPAMDLKTDLSTRLERAKATTAPRVLTGKYIDVNLGIQVMSLFEDGTLLDTYLISSGKRGMDTPKGEYQIRNKARRPFSKDYGLYMPYWMAIVPDGKMGIHELPEWPGGYKEGASHLGTPVSHGCIRLGMGAAGRAWNWAEIGTTVIVY